MRLNTHRLHTFRYNVALEELRQQHATEMADMSGQLEAMMNKNLALGGGTLRDGEGGAPVSRSSSSRRLKSKSSKSGMKARSSSKRAVR